MGILARVARTPLTWLGCVIGAQYLLGWDPPGVRLLAMVMGMAYLQNTTYAMQSRGGNRNSNAYHFIGAVLASLTYFWSLQLLVLNNVTYSLLAAYVFATVLGTVHGNKLCIVIEKRLGIYVPDEEMKKAKAEFMKLWPSVAILAVVLVVELVYLSARGVSVKLPNNGGTLMLGADVLVLFTVLSIAGSFTLAILRTARSADNYWFHAIAVVLNLLIEFAKLALLVRFKLNWALFVPSTIGGVIGSLLGANLAQSIVRRIAARFDVHILQSKEMKARELAGLVPWPTKQVALLSVFLVVQVVAVAYGYAVAAASLVLFLLATCREMSFTLKSRAGQRDSHQYLAWVSVLSNGVWFLTLGPLTLHGVTLDKAVPFIVGCAIGSLVGQLISMKVELLLDSRVDRPVPAARQVPA